MQREMDMEFEDMKKNLPKDLVKEYNTPEGGKVQEVGPPLIGAIASITSKNMMQGAACLAFLNTSRIPFSDSPTNLDNNSGPLILMKFASLSFAIALAKSVLPVPGGPYRNMPFGGFMWARPNSFLNLRGHSTASNNSSLTL